MMNNLHIAMLVGCIGCVTAFSAMAQTSQQTFVFNGGANVSISSDQKLMLEAANKFVQNDLSGAESLYTQAIALNGNNTEAYLQRAVVRRELHNEEGMVSDAKTVIGLSNNALQRNPNDPTVYYQRGMGYRLLRQFDQAKADITNGMQIGGKKNWETDLKAIEIERKVIK